MKTIKKVLPYILLAVVVVLMRAYLFNYMFVSGESMYPTLHNKDVIFVNKMDKKPKRGQVIVFNSVNVDPHEAVQYKGQKNVDYVKRVIGVPGDTVEQKDGQLYVNNKKVNEYYLSNKEKTSGSDQVKLDSNGYGTLVPNWNLSTLSKNNSYWNKASQNKETVPAGHYFVMGDHRSVSNDSRYFGFVPQKSISGVVKTPAIFFNKDTRQKVNTLYKNFFE